MDQIIKDISNNFHNLLNIGWGKIEISSIIIILLTAIISYLIGRRTTKIQRYDNAYEALHRAFVPTINILKKEKWTFRPGDFYSFRATFDSQETAMVTLLDRMRAKRIIKFKRIWGTYAYWQKRCETYDDCLDAIGLESNRKRLLADINELLEFAKKY